MSALYLRLDRDGSAGLAAALDDGQSGPQRLGLQEVIETCGTVQLEDGTTLLNGRTAHHILTPDNKTLEPQSVDDRVMDAYQTLAMAYTVQFASVYRPGGHSDDQGNSV